jgi:hypothetical protein
MFMLIGLLVKENVAVSSVGMRIALVCAVLAAIAYECFTMLYESMRIYYHNYNKQKSMELIKTENTETNKLLDYGVDKMFMLKKQIIDLNLQNRSVTKQNEGIIEQNKLLTIQNNELKALLEEERSKNMYLISNIKGGDNL